MKAEQVFSIVNALRQERKGYRSNCFLTFPQMQDLLSAGNTQVLCGDGLLLILQKEDDLVRVNYFARDTEALHKIGLLLPQSELPIIADVVGKNPTARQEADRLCDCGFQIYNTFVRMIAPDPILPKAGPHRVEQATLADSGRIYDMIHQEFDPLFSHFPNRDELEKYLSDGEITLIRAEGQIAGLAFFEHTSSRYITLRYFVVDSKFRGRNIGGCLLAHEWANRPEKAVYMLWVGCYNQTQELYKKLGFQYDGLHDYILRYGGRKNRNAAKR